MKEPRSYEIRSWFFLNGDASISRRSVSGLQQMLKEANRYFIKQAYVYFIDGNRGKSKREITRSWETAVGNMTLSNPLTYQEVDRYIFPVIMKGHHPGVVAHVVFLWGKSLTGLEPNKSGITRWLSSFPVPLVMVHDDCSPAPMPRSWPTNWATSCFTRMRSHYIMWPATARMIAI